MPENIDDKFFNRVKAAKKPKKEGEIFDTKKEVYKVNEERKTAQLNVDKQLMVAVKASPEKALLTSYLKSKFGLSNKQFPHQMKF